MRYRELPPSPSLRPFVECYWHLVSEGSGSWEPIYPDGCTEIILHRGDPADENRAGRALRQPRYLTYGPADALIRIRNAVRSDVIGIRLTPWGAHPLFGVPAARLAGGAVELEAVEPVLAHRLATIVESELSLAPAVRRLDACLRGWLRSRGREGEPEVASAARWLQANAAASLEDMYSLTGWSARTAQRRFKNEIGLSPKSFTRITRFLRFMRWGELEPDAPLASLALAAGYYDQPHLHRDLRRFTGVTPASYRNRRLATFDALYGSERLSRLVSL